eukprot:486519-Hanusia_phi.AAC.3
MARASGCSGTRRRATVPGPARPRTDPRVLGPHPHLRHQDGPHFARYGIGQHRGSSRKEGD